MTENLFQSATEQDLRPLFNERQRNQNMFVNTNLFFSGNNNTKTNNSNLNPSSQSISPSLNLQFQKQSQDIDHYIRFQNEKLQMMLQEQRKQQVALLLKKVESNVIYMLRQKDEEIAQAAKKRMELEEFLRRLEEENQAWDKEAQEKEVIALSLHNTLEQVKNGVATEDVGSCCNKEEGETRRGTMEEEVKAEQSKRKKRMVCQSCKSGKACFLFQMYM